MVKTPARSQFRRDFASRIKRLREKRGLSQADVALLLRIGYFAYKKAELRGSFDADLLLPLADILRVDVMYLLTGSGKNTLDTDSPNPRPKRNTARTSAT